MIAKRNTVAQVAASTGTIITTTANSATIKEGEGMCENEDRGDNCEELYNCCSCGGVDCGCRYCWDCNACDECKGA